MIMAIIDRIRQTIATVAPDKVFVITDSNVAVVESRLIEALDAAYVATRQLPRKLRREILN